MSEKLVEAVVDFATAIESACVQLKRYIAQEKGVDVKEGPFLSLKWEKREGSRLREYEVSTKVLNSGSENFQRCLNILKQNNATIANRFKDVGWLHSYWLYGESIYRQALKK